MAKILELYEAYKDNELPRDRGYIISEFLDDATRYAHYEVISYRNVKDIYINEDGLLFQSDGRKLYILFEPLNYGSKHLEPIHRDEAHRIPLRLKELEVYNTKRQEKVMIAKEPIVTYTSFTIAKETGLNTSYIVYNDESSIRTILGFFEQSLWKTLNITRTDARNACDLIAKPMEILTVPDGLS